MDSGVDAAAVAEPDAPPDPREVVRAEIVALEQLLEGRLPTDLDPQTLFEVDLLDERARDERVHDLRQLTSDVPEQTELADGGITGDAQIDLDGSTDGSMDASADAWADAGLESDLDASPPEGGMDAGLDAGLDAGAPPDVAAEPVDEELAALELERDLLRLRFLSLAETEREQVIDAVRARRRIAVEEHASRVDAERASADAQRATEARDDLLDRAAGSGNAIQSALLAEQARIEAARAELARWRLRFARERETQAQEGARRLQRIHELELTVDSLEPGEANARYDEVVDVLEEQRRRLDRSIDSLDAPSEVPVFDLGLEEGHDSLTEGRILAAAVREFESEIERERRSEASLRLGWAERLADDVRALDQVRVRLLPRLSEERRDAVLGLGPEGRAQLGRELDQIRLMGRFWLREVWHELPTYPGRVGALFLTSGTRTELAWALVILLFIVVLWRQRETITEWLRRFVHDRSGTRSWVGLIRPFWAVIGPIVVPLVLVATLHLLFAILEQLTDALTLEVIEVVVIRIAWFFVAVTAVARFFVSRLRYGAGRAIVARRIFGSVRLVMGFGLVVILIIDLSELLVGHGYLFGLVVDLSWLGGIPIALLLVHQWSKEVCASHRDRYPTGYIERALAGGDSRVKRYLLTPFGAAQLALAGIWATFKELALRFDQFRSAFAFLFRRRLERRIEAQIDESQVETLPAAVQEAFTEEPPPTELQIDYFPGLEGIVERVDGFIEGDDPGFAVALVGERGSGKTTWLRELDHRLEGRSDVFDVPHRLTDSVAVCRWLSSRLDLPSSRTIDELAEAIEALQEPRVIILDHCQNLVVRAIGGTAGLEALVELAARTSEHVIWVCSFARYTWQYMELARQGQDLFGSHVSLEPWPEEKIVELIHHRMKAEGLEASFRDLVVDQLVGNALEDAVLRTEREYLRLLWDFAVGNPRVAIHFWKHSLTEGPDGMKVRLFAAPLSADLEGLHDQSRFLLATIALHENATLSEAATSAGSSPRECSALLAYLSACGYVREDDEGQWRLSTHWYRDVVRHLRKQRLLFE